MKEFNLKEKLEVEMFEGLIVPKGMTVHDMKEFPEHQRKILAAVERARACDMPAMVLTPAEYYPDAVVEALRAEPETEVFTITMSGFTQRKEFFSMLTPDEEGFIRYFKGAIYTQRLNHQR